MGEEFSKLTQKGTTWLGETVGRGNNGGSRSGQLADSQLQGDEGRDRYPQDFPLLVVNYHETFSTAGDMGLTDVNKPRRRGVVEL